MCLCILSLNSLNQFSSELTSMLAMSHSGCVDMMADSNNKK